MTLPSVAVTKGNRTGLGNDLYASYFTYSSSHVKFTAKPCSFYTAMCALVPHNLNRPTFLEA